ncbi:COQ9 family protein [Sneathiella marina]|uniref:COQ9 family protein n=1 Tax=Sneathiella marina TaxID=2950108 RepID=A0ABY4W6S9_9PROT|nr:COQ9 family protein [Sneathiella marina]USG62880.1 COQ9 family protein [Sneathiella marina]
MTPIEKNSPLQLLEAVLPHVLFDGWSRKAMIAAAKDLKTDMTVFDLTFPDGAIDMITLFIRNADDRMEAELEARGVRDMKIRDRITLAIRSRLELYGPQKEAVRRAVNILTLPQNAVRATKLTANTVSLMWYATGDTSADFNWYSKRLTLSAVYGATLLFWLDDKSEDHAKTWEFLDRRIENIMQIETAKWKLKKSFKEKPDFSHLPSAKRFFRNLRMR